MKTRSTKFFNNYGLFLIVLLAFNYVVSVTESLKNILFYQLYVKPNMGSILTNMNITKEDGTGVIQNLKFEGETNFLNLFVGNLININMLIVLISFSLLTVILISINWKESRMTRSR